jgi:hypothetical protein
LLTEHEKGSLEKGELSLMKKMYKIKLTKVRAKPIIDKIAKEI